MIEEGKKAPAFKLKTDGGGEISLSALKGKNAVVYFYPKDDTPGCTTEAIDFSALKSKFDACDTVIIGISKDSVSRHDSFKNKHKLKLILAADEAAEVIEKFGVWVLKQNYGKEYMGIERSTFLIDAKGIVRKIWRKVRVNGHAQDVLVAAKEL